MNGLAGRPARECRQLGGRETRRRIDAYDAMGDHVLAVEAAGTAEETRTEYACDGSGLLVSASVGGAAATVFEHDAAGAVADARSALLPRIAR